MTDREMLELAAKAAGYDANLELNGSFSLWNEEIECVQSIWNPLEDDGDALRLAVKLHMQVSITTESCRAETQPVLGVRVNDNDEFAATRRAIVMAAANASADKL